MSLIDLGLIVHNLNEVHRVTFAVSRNLKKMNDVNDLLQLLKLEQIEDNIFRGPSHSIGSRRVFGGQVLAQALTAAINTVPEDRIVHSLHGYFILPGDVERPIIYDVDRIRDGRSFTTRRIVAIQHGRAIFNSSVSFQIQEDGFDHQIPMPDVPDPELLKSDTQIISENVDYFPKFIQRTINRPRPIEFRPVQESDLIDPTPGKPFRQVWLRAKGKLSDSAKDHCTVLAYASDYNLLTTAMRPHKVSFDQLVIASLDHAMWFHRRFRADEWLLFALDSPSASNSRGFTRGNFFNRDGILVASVVQEGLLRKKTR